MAELEVCGAVLEGKGITCIEPRTESFKHHPLHSGWTGEPHNSPMEFWPNPDAVPVPKRERKRKSKHDPKMDELEDRVRSGQEGKDQGQEQVLANTPDEWKSNFVRQARVLAGTGAPFTSESITSVVGFPADARGLAPGSVEAKGANNAVGANMTALAKQGIIRKTGRRVPAERPNQHAAMLEEWVGVEPIEPPHPQPLIHVLKDFG